MADMYAGVINIIVMFCQKSGMSVYWPETQANLQQSVVYDMIIVVILQRHMMPGLLDCITGRKNRLGTYMTPEVYVFIKSALPVNVLTIKEKFTL